MPKWCNGSIRLTTARSGFKSRFRAGDSGSSRDCAVAYLAFLAHPVEHLSCKQEVVGSRPTEGSGSNILRDLRLSKSVAALLGPLVQLEERRTFNPRVVGSSPTGASFTMVDTWKLLRYHHGAGQPDRAEYATR